MTDNFHFILMQLFNGHSQTLQREARALGLSPGQPKILECLDSGKALSPRQIGKICMIDKATMTSLLGKMEKDGLVMRLSNPADHRSVLIQLTDKGMDKARQINRAYRKIDEAALSCFSTDEKQQLLRWLRLIASKYMED